MAEMQNTSVLSVNLWWTTLCCARFQMKAKCTLKDLIFFQKQAALNYNIKLKMWQQTSLWCWTTSLGRMHIGDEIATVSGYPATLLYTVYNSSIIHKIKPRAPCCMGTDCDTHMLRDEPTIGSKLWLLNCIPFFLFPTKSTFSKN